MDPGSRTLAVQDFRHTLQAEEERVADFTCWLECTFNIAYGREGMSTETHDTLLHGQLQEVSELEKKLCIEQQQYLGLRTTKHFVLQPIMRRSGLLR